MFQRWAAICLWFWEGPVPYRRDKVFVAGCPYLTPWIIPRAKNRATVTSSSVRVMPFVPENSKRSGSPKTWCNPKICPTSWLLTRRSKTLG